MEAKKLDAYLQLVEDIKKADAVFVDCAVFGDYIKVSKKEILYTLSKADISMVQWDNRAGFVFIDSKHTI